MYVMCMTGGPSMAKHLRRNDDGNGNGDADAKRQRHLN